jgi:parallel beta-helix repeat protein
MSGGNMKKELLQSLALITILIAVAGMVNIQGTRASKTLIVPDEYATINAAVNQASAGDTILVKSGVYHENIQVSKSLTLEGQNSANTIIVGSGGSSPTAVLTLAADNVRVSGLTIESLNYSITTRYAYGIWVEGNNCTITGNVIENTYIGIFCSIQSSTTITQNNIKSSIKDGVRFFGGSLNNISDNNIIGNGVSGISMDGYSNTISKNNIQDNYRGVGFGASYSVLFGNNIQSNAESGVFLAGSQNIISANNISNNKYGVFVTLQLTAPLGDRIYHNNLVNNIYNAHDNSSALVEYWDNGFQSGGNYWSDYLLKYPGASQVDSSGIGNTPYTINSNNTDNHPLMSPFNTSNLGNPPTAISPPPAKPNSVVASWSLGTVYASLLTPDATGNNPAVLGSETANYNYTPALVPGKFGEALNFTGNVYATVHPSPSLETPEEVTIDAWVNVQAIKGVPYDNIFIEAVRTTATLPTRTLGLAVNGQTPENASSPPLGALRGYVATSSGLNEIDTKVALPLDTWVHVVFTRSTTTGMHIYVNGVEQAVTVAAGTANPKGSILNPTDIYIGHDSKTEIEDLQISNTVYGQTPPLWTQWWLWTIILAAALVGGLILYRKRFRRQTIT